MMRKTSMFGLLAVLGAGCAHQQVVEPPAVAVTPPRAAQPPQVEVSPAPATDQDGLSALEAALKNATAYFDFNGDRLNDEGMNALQRVAEVLRKHPALQVRIDGNCDERLGPAARGGGAQVPGGARREGPAGRHPQPRRRAAGRPPAHPRRLGEEPPRRGAARFELKATRAMSPW